MPTGGRTRRAIFSAIQGYDRFLVIISESSLQSDWVDAEVEKALGREQREKVDIILPVRIDDAVEDTDSGWGEDLWRRRDIRNFRKWKDHDAYQEAFARLLRDLSVEES